MAPDSAALDLRVCPATFSISLVEFWIVATDPSLYNMSNSSFGGRGRKTTN